MLTNLGFCCLWLFIPGIVGVIPEIVVSRGSILLFVLLCSVWPFHLTQTVTIVQRHRALALSFLVDLLNVVVN